MADIIINGRHCPDPEREIAKAGEKPCFACGDPAKHRHHMLQIKNGGHNGPRNIVLLCEQCHRDVHKYS